MPSEQERAERLSAVLHVLYLIFNEGYVSTAGADLSRPDLSNEAIRLTRVVHALDPKDGEVGALLALMVLTDARRSARVGPAGELIPLDEQDRAAWDQRLISEGCALVSDALSRGAIGPYQIQAAIAAVHSEGASASSTDWPQIKALYSLLMRISDNPMVALNHAIAVAMVDGSAAGLALVDALELVPRMRGHHRLAAVRAHLLSMAGDRDGAIRWFHVAAASTASVPERNYLLGKISRLAARD
jgi:predicted RNA polymerase sigma factor